jgi:hypothetical protein
MSVRGKFCCKSQLRQAEKRDSVVVKVLGEVDP